MDKLFENLSFLCGSIGACIIIFTCFLIIRSLLKFFNDDAKDKQIKELKKEIKDLHYRLETKTEMERLRYEHSKIINRK